MLRGRLFAAGSLGGGYVVDLWTVVAFGSALFAGLTAILAKCGVRHTDSDVATAVRTLVVLVFSWVMVAVEGTDVPATLASISGRSYVFLALSGLATGASWICYFKARATGDVNKVVPIDKSSTVLSVLLAIVLFGETGHLAVKLGSTVAILVGTLMMVERRGGRGARGGAGLHGSAGSRAWLAYAVASAVFAALTSILAKVGVEGMDSNLAMALRTCVVLVMAWAVVAVKGKLAQVRRINSRELAFLVLSGLATGASWLCYYYAIQMGQVSIVVQIDKLSILVSVAFSWLVFGERLSRAAAAGLVLIVCGTLFMTIWT